MGRRSNARPGNRGRAWCGLGLAALLSACALGNEHHLAGAPVDASVRGAGAVTVAVHDRRQEVVAGTEGPQVVGVQRTGVGIPRPVTTRSGKPLATVAAEALAGALAQSGFDPQVHPAGSGSTWTQVVEAAVGRGAPRTVVVTIESFRTDTYNGVIFDYDLTLTVLDGSGTALARARAKAEGEDLGRSLWNPPKHAMEVVPKAFARVLETLLDDPKVAAALGGPLN